MSGAPIGLGPRVPMFVISPWSRGGRVNSEVFDHTSVLRFLENWTGVKEPNISAWRRTVCGDLMSTLDFSSSSTTFPSLPDTSALVTAADQENSLPAPSAPTSSFLPGQESGSRPVMPVGYRFAMTSWTDTSTGRIWMQVVNNGSLGAGFTAYTVNYRAFASWQYTVAAGATVKDHFSAKTYGGGPYDVDWHGPDGFLRGFKGNVLTWSDTTKAHPEAYVVDVPSSLPLTLTLTNAAGSGATATFTVSANAYGGGTTRTVKVAPGSTATVTLPSSTGLYDYTVTADTDDNFARRFAGRIQP